MPLAVRPKQQNAGPWLDRLFPIQLPGGRHGSVTGFCVLPSNIGIMEGGLDARTNAMQRAKILRLAEERYGKPVVEVEPTIVLVSEAEGSVRRRERLPWMACVARLTSEPIDSYMVASELTLLWWQDSFEAPLPQEIERAAAGVDWVGAAVDVDLL